MCQSSVLTIAVQVLGRVQIKSGKTAAFQLFFFNEAHCSENSLVRQKKLGPAKLYGQQSDPTWTLNYATWWHTVGSVILSEWCSPAVQLFFSALDLVWTQPYSGCMPLFSLFLVSLQPTLSDMGRIPPKMHPQSKFQFQKIHSQIAPLLLFILSSTWLPPVKRRCLFGVWIPADSLIWGCNFGRLR